MWIPLAITTAIAFALSGSYAKALSKRAHVFVVTWAMITLSLPATVLYLAHQGLPEIAPAFWHAAAVSIVVNMVSVTLQVKALKLSPLSLTVPFLAFTPLFMLLTSWIILGEVPDAKGVLGILLIVGGAYSVHLDKIHGGILAPIRAIASEPGSRLMLLVALIWSVSAAYDKVAVVASSAAFYTCFFSVAFGLLYLPALVIGLRRTPLERGVLPRLFALALVEAVMILSQWTAIGMALASYVIAIKRAGMVVSVVLGYVFFRERHIATRLLGSALMVAGVLAISL